MIILTILTDEVFKTLILGAMFNLMLLSFINMIFTVLTKEILRKNGYEVYYFNATEIFNEIRILNELSAKGTDYSMIAKPFRITTILAIIHFAFIILVVILRIIGI